MPPVYLNHVYRVLDTETFRAADASEYLRSEFAPFERRTTKSGDDSWTGLYFYGESTYFEFLAADPKRDRPVGQSGVAFGDRAGGGQRRRPKDARWTRPRPRPGEDDRPHARNRRKDGPLVPDDRLRAEGPRPGVLGDGVFAVVPEEVASGAASGTVGHLAQGRARALPGEGGADRAAQGPSAEERHGVSDRARSEARRVLREGARRSRLAAGGEGRRRLLGRTPTRTSRSDAAGDARGIVAIEMSLTRQPEESKVLALSDRARLEIRTDGTAAFLF